MKTNVEVTLFRKSLDKEFSHADDCLLAFIEL
jgi:hypothetical protein